MLGDIGIPIELQREPTYNATRKDNFTRKIKNYRLFKKMKDFQRLRRTTLFGFILILFLCGCGKQPEDQPLKSIISAPPRNQEIKAGESIYFEGKATGGVPPYSYLWNFDVCAPQSSEKTPGELIFQYEGAYNITLSVIDSKGKTDIVSVDIFVKPKSEF
jgi:hypothetical protein